MKRIYAIIASGPSLSMDQVELLKKYQADARNLQVIAINDNYKIAPWADYVFASDLKWWRRNYDDVCNVVDFDTNLHTIQSVVQPLFKNRKEKKEIRWDYITRDVDDLKTDPDMMYHGGCSGILAMELARLEDIMVMSHDMKIILVGYDMQHTDGKAHWFGDHPKGFLNANACDIWKKNLESMIPYYEKMGIEVVNCSIETAIEPDIVRRSTLDNELKTLEFKRS